MTPPAPAPRPAPPIQLGRGSDFAGPPEIIAFGDRSTISVGRYCSLAPGIRFIVDAEHETGRVTTSPRHGTDVPGTRGDIAVGHDVWIGAYATLLSGVTIGDGAVVGAAAVVAKDVPPFAVVVGNPAKIVRYRFDPATVEALRAIRWWDWSEERIAAAADLLYSERIGEFIARYGVPLRHAESTMTAGLIRTAPPSPSPETPSMNPTVPVAPAPRAAAEPTSPARCVVLVPVGGAIDAGCEEGLRELERRGYPVRRVRGYSAIDAARCQMATDALRDGFDELMWIDSDVAFDPADVETLRSHGQPFTCGLYPKKGLRQFANNFLPGTANVRFGVHGGLIDILYCGFGFTHVRREVFDAVRRSLPECNRGFRHALVPYFQPLVAADGRGDPWYLNEDFAFCERARQAGFAVQADTTIRLWHVGSYRYGWEDAGRDVQRFADYTFHPHDAGPTPAKPAAKPVAKSSFSEDWFSRHVPVWKDLLGPLAGRECHALEVGVFEGRSTVWLLENILAHPASTLTYVDTFAGGTEHAALDLTDLEARFRANTAAHAAKLIARPGRSDAMLRDLPRDRYDFVSIDGSHEAADVLSDAVLAWPLVKPGGLVCFDDYEWWIDAAPERSPKLAIDAFLAAMRGRLEVIRTGEQVWVRKPA